MRSESIRNMTVDQLVRVAFFAPLIGGPMARAELRTRFGFVITEDDINAMKIAVDQFAADHPRAIVEIADK